MNARWFGKVYLLVLGVAIFYWPVVTSAQTITYGPANTFATPASDFVNTGSGGTVGGETVSGNTPTQWVATQFTLTETTAITQVSGWFGATGAGGAINVVIRVDNPANPSLPVPGAEIWSQSFTVPAQNAPNWVNFSNFIPVLAPGTYWLSFEPPVTSALKTGMYGPSANPQPNSAFYVPSNGRWINYNEGNGHTTAYPGVQISGLYLETSVGQGVVPFGTAARTITQGTVFNMFPFSQYLDPVGAWAKRGLYSGTSIHLQRKPALMAP
jgi:hypothetical protein